MKNQNKYPLIPLVDALAPLTGDHKVSYENILTDYLRSHGLAESTRQIACARLAGMLVILAALGEQPSSIVFMKTLDIPLSWASGVVCNAGYLEVLIDENTEIFNLLKIAIHLQSGKAGEVFINFDHPVSLFEDMYKFIACCVFLGFKADLATEVVAARIAGKSREILELNAEVYNQVFKLFESKYLPKVTEIRKLLSQVPLTEIDSLLTRIQ